MKTFKLIIISYLLLLCFRGNAQFQYGYKGMTNPRGITVYGGNIYALGTYWWYAGLNQGNHIKRQVLKLNSDGTVNLTGQDQYDNNFANCITYGEGVLVIGSGDYKTPYTGVPTGQFTIMSMKFDFTPNWETILHDNVQDNSGSSPKNKYVSGCNSIITALEGQGQKEYYIGAGYKSSGQWYNSNYEYTSSAVQVSKVDEFGNPKWTRLYKVSSQGNYHDIAQNISLAANGDYIITGYSSNTHNANDKKMFILRLNPLGNKVWFKEYYDTQNSPVVESAKSVVEVGSGASQSIVVVGEVDNHIMVFSVNSSTGAFQWAKKIGVSSGLINGKATSVIKTGPNEITFTGNMEHLSSGNEVPFIAKYSTTTTGMTKVFFKVYGNGSYVEKYPFQILPNVGGGYVVGALTDINNTSPKPPNTPSNALYLFTTDVNGNTASGSSYGLTEECDGVELNVAVITFQLVATSLGTLSNDYLYANINGDLYPTFSVEAENTCPSCQIPAIVNINKHFCYGETQTLTTDCIDLLDLKDAYYWASYYATHTTMWYRNGNLDLTNTSQSITINETSNDAVDYSAQCYNQYGCKIAEVHFTVTVSPPPVAYLEPIVTVCGQSSYSATLDGSSYLTNAGVGATCFWQDASGTKMTDASGSIISNPIITQTISANTSFDFTIVDQYGCIKETHTYQVEKCCEPIVGYTGGQICLGDPMSFTVNYDCITSCQLDLSIDYGDLTISNASYINTMSMPLTYSHTFSSTGWKVITICIYDHCKNTTACGYLVVQVISCKKSNTTGISETKEENGLKLFPNPVNTELNIEISEAVKNGKVTISDITGKVMKEETMEDGVKQLKVSTKDLISGMYILSIQSEDKVYHSNFLKK
ncbi:MAG: T9SS type A sorting domain-containing protein [Bacteroidetes bacterium]|nr:T9SS type A sorting domain-containing protein [Bacteroidota bacterium]